MIYIWGAEKKDSCLNRALGFVKCGEVSLKLDIPQTFIPDPATSSYSVSPSVGSKRSHWVK